MSHRWNYGGRITHLDVRTLCYDNDDMALKSRFSKSADRDGEWHF